MLLEHARARAALVLLLMVPLAGEAAQRTFVSIGGSDGNTASNCSSTSPCRGFAAALTVTDSGGEIIVKDSGGYGPVTIAKSVSLIAPDGVYAGISVTSGNGVTIATPGIKVVLRGLSINGLGGSNGVSMTDGDELLVENCHIANFSTIASIGLNVAGSIRVKVLRSIFADDYYGAFFAAGAKASLDGTHFTRGYSGVVVSASGGMTARASVTRSSSNNAVFHGFLATADSGGVAELEVKDSEMSANSIGGYVDSGTGSALASFINNVVVANSLHGLGASGAGATLTASGNTVTRNGTGLMQTASAVLRSAGDNVVIDNVTGTTGIITSFSKV